MKAYDYGKLEYNFLLPHSQVYVYFHNNVNVRVYTSDWHFAIYKRFCMSFARKYRLRKKEATGHYSIINIPSSRNLVPIVQ